MVYYSQDSVGFFRKVSFGRYRYDMFLENDVTNQHHLRGVGASSLGRQLTLYGGENQSRVLAYGEFSCFLKDCCIFDVLSWCPLSVKQQVFFGLLLWYC